MFSRSDYHEIKIIISSTCIKFETLHPIITFSDRKVSIENSTKFTVKRFNKTYKTSEEINLKWNKKSEKVFVATIFLRQNNW